MQRPSPLVRGALDRIERVATVVLAKASARGRSAAALRSGLEDGLGPLDAVLQLLPDVFAGRSGAGRNFRSWLVRSASGRPGHRPCPPDPKRDGVLIDPASRPLAVDGARADVPAFQSGGVFFRMRIAAALTARGRDDFRGMRDGVDAMLLGAQWVESFDGAARGFERTGDAIPFESRATLYFQTREFPGECDLGPPEAFVDDARGCLAFLDAELERAILATEHDVVQDTTADVWADNISEVIFERDGCGGVIEIRGDGFGDVQPEHVDLLLPSPEGCSSVSVPPADWTNQRIRVAAPAWLCTGCVGFGGRGTDRDPFGTRRTAIERVAVALSKASRACRSVFGGAFEPVSTHSSGGRGCPGCTGRNRVEEPLSVTFTVNGAARAEDIDSHGVVSLAGRVECADSTVIVRTGPGPDVTGLAPAGLRRFEETREVRFAIPTPTSTITYTLIARPATACERRVTVTVGTVMSQRNQRLMRLQQNVLARYGTLGIDGDAKYATELHRHGQTYIATHFDYSAEKNIRFAGTGIVFANKGDADRVENEDAPNIDPDNPSLLLFDDNNRLIGCGFFGFESGDNHPSQFGREDTIGVAPSEWFFHVAGYHRGDGGFTPDPNPPWVTLPPDDLTLSGGQPAKWHPRTWDVHIFFNVDAASVPLGPPVVGTTTASFASPPNIPRDTAFGITDPCPGGVGEGGFYESQ